MVRPNFFIIGAMKAGTTSLHNYLNYHPSVFMCEPKEPGYFVQELNWSEGEDWYLNLFKGAGDESIIGESSTHYTKFPTYAGVAERLFHFSPDARLVYIMRDPVKRALSQYWFSVDSSARRPVAGIYMENRPLMTALKEESSYVDFSDYALQLKQYLDFFPADHIYTLSFESLIANPAMETGNILSWLGVSGELDKDVFRERFNATSESIARVKGFGLLQRLRTTKAWDCISPMIPKVIRSVGTSLAVGEDEKNQSEEEKAIEFLRSVLLEKTDGLTRLLGREFPEWRTLYGS